MSKLDYNLENKLFQVRDRPPLPLSLSLSLSRGEGGGVNCSHRRGKTCSVQAVFKFVDFWPIQLINEADHRPNKMPNSSEAHRLGIGFFHPVLMEILKKKSGKVYPGKEF